MNRSTLVLAVLATCVAAPSASSADAVRGEQLALRWCATCHVVSPDQRQANVDAPSFATIAKNRDLDPARLTFLLLSPHPVMPELALGRREAEDIVAYITKLRSGRVQPRTQSK